MKYFTPQGGCIIIFLPVYYRQAFRCCLFFDRLFRLYRLPTGKGRSCCRHAQKKTGRKFYLADLNQPKPFCRLHQPKCKPLVALSKLYATYFKGLRVKSIEKKRLSPLKNVLRNMGITGDVLADTPYSENCFRKNSSFANRKGSNGSAVTRRMVLISHFKTIFPKWEKSRMGERMANQRKPIS